jgi:hypothetical protein
MEPEGSLPCPQEPSIGPYPEPEPSSPHHPFLFILDIPCAKSHVDFHVLTSFQRIRPSPRSCVTYHSKVLPFTVRSYYTHAQSQSCMTTPCRRSPIANYTHAQSQSWRTTPCRRSPIAYSIYSQLPTISGVCFPCVSWGCAMPWSNGINWTHHGSLSWVKLIKSAPSYPIYLISVVILSPQFRDSCVKFCTHFSSALCSTHYFPLDLAVIITCGE